MPKQYGDWSFPQGNIVPYFPRVKGLDWNAYMKGKCALVIVNDEMKALRLCLGGVPAIAIVGVSKERVAEWLRKRGANVIDRGAVH